MVYPVFSYSDGTEVTASKPDENGNILLYIEKFDTLKDDFINITFILPSMTVKSLYGYSDDEINNMLAKYSEIKMDIVDYITEKVKKSA